MKILVIEDDKAVRNLITAALDSFGYHAEAAGNGAEAVRMAVSERPELFVLDLGLPDMDGTEIIKKLRSWTQNPIIVVSARSEVNDKILALDAGADDYLTKPFSVEELMARIRVAERRLRFDGAEKASDTVFVNGALKIDYTSKLVFVDGERIHVTRMEYDLLCLMARNVDKVLTHNYILEQIWTNPLTSDTQSLRVFMASLRKKIEKDPANPRYLQTHIGIGYRLVREVE